MLLLVLLTSFIRQSWNLGVAFLCFWLFLETLTAGINGIIWSSNAEIKLYVYCDIVSRLQMVALIVKPMATLIIIRRLYLIASLRSIELPSKHEKRKDLLIEWTLGLMIPLLFAGPLYYVVQQLRFEVDEGFGCTNSADGSLLSILLMYSVPVVAPAVSIVVYYPHVARIFYRQGRDIDHFLRSNDSISRTNYFRVLALASIDILLTLPIGIAAIVLTVKDSMSQVGFLVLYFGWTHDHSNWGPESFSYEELVTSRPSGAAQYFFIHWTSPVLAFIIFGLFGITSEARASYWRAIYFVGSWFGLKPSPRERAVRSPLGDIEFGERSPRVSMSLRSQPGFVNIPSAYTPTPGHAAEDAGGRGLGKADSSAGSGVDQNTVDDALRVPRAPDAAFRVLPRRLGQPLAMV
ncbi:unnamed protein product [Peniophora sp. CBMAI 1063]|nr:unnamed protein product [Peniophora sp. CBMAI 1063]